MNLLPFIVLLTVLFTFSVLVLEYAEDCLCVIPSKFSKIFWCKNCDQIEIGEGATKLCPRCGDVCTVIKF
jgi:Zn finger protein HypA/HybF involved in hydrogenase expression